MKPLYLPQLTIKPGMEPGNIPIISGTLEKISKVLKIPKTYLSTIDVKLGCLFINIQLKW